MTLILTLLAVESYQRHAKKLKKMMKTSERKSNQESPQECHTVTDREDEEVSSKDFVQQLPSVKNHAYVFFTSVSTEDIEVRQNAYWRLFNDGYLLEADNFLDLSGAAYPLFANQRTHKVPLIDFTDPLEEITAPVSCLNRRERIFKHRSAHKLIFTIKNLTHSQTSAVIQFLSKIIGFKHWRYKYTLINENRMLLVVRCCMQRVGSVIWKTYVITAIIPLLIYGAPRPVEGKPVDRFPQERCIENSKTVEFRFETNKKEIPLPWKVQGDFSIPPSPNTPCPQNGHHTSSNNPIIENTELHLVNGKLEDKETCVYQRREQDVALNELIERTDQKYAEFRHADVAFNYFSPGNHSVHPIIYPVHGSNVSLLSIHRLMKHEILRIRSYNQQITMPIYSVTQLAQNGFYCSGQNGEVTCFNCERKHPTFLSGLSLDETSHMGGCGTTREINNVPLHNGTGGLTSADLDLFHAIYGYQGNSSSFSNLDASSISSKDFVQQLPSVENHAYVFFTSVSTEDIEVRQNAYWRLFNDGYLPEADNFLDLSGAAYPLFANRRTRKDTFHSWDPTHSQKPEILVNMGFFYAGYSDCARCFYCGLGLKYWRPNDDAAYQHARFRPQCKYNQFVQGQVFVDQVQRAISTENTQGAGAGADAVEVPNLDQLMRSNAARQVLEEGWEHQEVRDGVARLVQDLGEECLTYAILMEVLVNIQTERAGQATTNPPASGQTTSSHPASGQTGQSGTNSTPAASQSASKAVVGETHDGVPSSQDNVTAIGAQRLPSGDNTEHDSLSATGGEMGGVTLEPDVVLRLIEREHNYRKKRMQCMQCGNRKIGCIYLPCGHVVACQPCGDDASTCILCGKVIAAIANIYLS